MQRSGHIGSSTADECSVYFSGAPQSVTERQIRTLFETLGHVQGLRLIPSRNRPVMDGYVDFSDPNDAKAAVERLHGHLFSPSSAANAAEATSVVGGEFKLNVQLASNRKRMRNNRNAHKQGSDEEGEDGYGTGPPLNLPAHYRDPVSMVLRKVSASDAFEAVEQLRVIALEKPDETRELLEQHPALKVAVVEILQVAGKLPQHLPQEAFKTNASGSLRSALRSEDAHSRQPMSSSALGTASGVIPTTGGASAVLKSVMDTQAQIKPSAAAVSSLTTEQIIAQVEKLTEPQINKLMSMSDTDFLRVNEPKRSELKALQAYLLSL